MQTGWAHCMLPNTFKNARPQQDGGVNFPEPVKANEKKLVSQNTYDDGTGTVSTYIGNGTGTETFGGFSTDGDGSASWSTGTSTFREDLPGNMSFRPVHSMIQEVEEGNDIDRSPSEAYARGAEVSPDGAMKELPSQGSKLHGTGTCRPCAWFHKAQGCSNGADCRHCHLCDEGEIKSRKKMKVASIKEARDGSKVSTSEDANHSSTAEDNTPKPSSKVPPGLSTPEKIDRDSVRVGCRIALEKVASSELPSVGSSLHAAGTCRPCAWFHKPQGCSNGVECRHCHMCPEGELKTRKKDKVASIRQDSKNAAQDDDDTNVRPWSSMGFDLSPISPVAMSPFDYAGMPPPFMPPAPVFFPGSTSVGSALHGTGMCRPCAWFWKAQGCANGAQCFHCHLCPEGEISQRKKQKLQVMRIISSNTPNRRLESKNSRASKTSYVESDEDDADTEPPAANHHNGRTDEARHVQETPKMITEMQSVAPAKSIAGDMPVKILLPKDMDLPSAGSALHGTGNCKPCAWFHKPQGCSNGKECGHCHVCDEGELQKRRKAKVNAIKTGSKTFA